MNASAAPMPCIWPARSNSGIASLVVAVWPEFGGLAPVWWWQMAVDVGFCVVRRRSGGVL